MIIPRKNIDFNFRDFIGFAFVLLITPVLFGLTELYAQTDSQSVSELIAVNGEESETALAELIQQALDSGEIGGAFHSYQGSTLSGISPGQVALKVLQKNLALSITSAESELAKEASLEAKAVFDPVLNLNVGISKNESHERTEKGTVVAKVFRPQFVDPVTGVPGVPGEIILPEEAQMLTGVEAIIFNNLQEDQEIREDQTIFASKKDLNGAPTSLDFTIGLDQLTPWGISYDLSLTTVKKEVFYDANGHSFGAPWASKLLFNVQIPIGNDFGEDSSASVGARLSNLENSRQEWLLKNQINTILRQAAGNYLRLITATEQYRIAVENRLLSEEQFQSTQRRFKSRSATAYELSQIEAELALAQSGEELAAKTYLSTSDALLALTNDKSDFLQGRLLVPQGYTHWLATPLVVNEAAAQQTARDNRPILQAGMLEQAKAEVQQRNARLRTRPDIRLNASLGLEQNGSVFGYKSVAKSLTNVLDPDNTTLNLNAEYLYPIGNKGVKARKRISDAQLNDTQLALSVSRHNVELEVNNALNNLHTSKLVRAQAQLRLIAANKAYKSILRRAKNGSATQNEIVSTLRQLISAKTANIQSIVSIKQAEADLLAAEGIIDKSYAQWVAKNDFENWRLLQLAKYDEFRYFIH